MKVTAFIPARYGSTRLPGKPLSDIEGKPMIEWVYSRVSQAKSVTKVTVATDDERVKKAVLDFGGNVVMTSTDCRTGTERVAEALRLVAGDTDIVVNMQGDEPQIEPQLIDDCIAPLLNDESIGLSTPVVKITDPGEIKDPHVVKAVADLNGFALYFSRSPVPNYVDPGAVPPVLYKHVGLYVYRKEVLLKLAGLAPTPLEQAEKLEQLRALENGIKIKLVETEYNPVAVDTPEDLEKVRAIFKAGDF